MKTKRILSLLLTVAMLLSCGITARASGSISMEVGESETLYTSLDGDDYDWTCQGNAISMGSGNSDSIRIVATREGSATVSVRVTKTVYTYTTEIEYYYDDETGEEYPIEIEVEDEDTELVGTETWTIEVTETEPEPEPEVYVSLEIDPRRVELTAGDDVYVSAYVTSGDRNAIANWDWQVDNPSIASVSGDDLDAVITARKEGSTTVTLTARRNDGSEAGSARCSVTVTEAYSPVTVTGGKDISMKAGTEQNIQAGVSGGSGSYEYVWTHEGAVAVRDSMRQNATIYAMDAGTGYVTLTVYDPEDRSNCDSTTWTISVESSATPLKAVIKPSSLTIGAGESATLSVTASGGSGNSANYDYNWYTSSSKIDIDDSGAKATVTALSAGTATVSVDVYDTVTGTVVTAQATIIVEGGSATYNASGSTTVGEQYPLDPIVNNLSAEFKRHFGSAPGSGAMIRFDSPSSRVGMLRRQDGYQPRANENLSFSSLMLTFFDPIQAGTFSTGYALTDGGNTLSGTITITASGGAAVTNVAISDASIDMATYSSRYLSVKITPSNAPYTVSWRSSNDDIAYISGSGTSVTVNSRGYVGSAKITAVVTGTNGGSFTRTCMIYVSSSATYDPTLAVTLGSDYYGTGVTDSVSRQFRNVFGYSLNARDARISFSSTGNSRYGVMHLANGSPIRANTSYTYEEAIAMYFEPVAAGTFTLPYSLSYKGDSLNGTLSVYIREPSLSATLNHTSMTLSTYSSQSLSLEISPANAYYRVSWRSSNTKIVTVSGSGASVTVKSGDTTGSATIYATVTDRDGVEILRSCTVTVTNKNNRYDPSVTTTIGVPYRGTGTSDAMKAQFRSLYGVNLPDSATISFDSTGNNNVAVMRLANGTPVRANTNYTMAEYVLMYTDTVAAGIFSVPYTLTYNGNSLVGNIIVNVNLGTVMAALSLDGTQPYQFSAAAAGGAVGSSVISSSIMNAVGGNWSYLRFGYSTSGTGTLYRNSNRASLDNANILQSELGSLYFVPSSAGDYSVVFAVYNSAGNSIASGTLYIHINQAAPVTVSFTDVDPNNPYHQWFVQPVQWAVSRGITNGMTPTTFEPNTTCKTAHILTFLWRSQGSPMPTISNPFGNLKGTEYYYNAAIWAYEKGLIGGVLFDGANTDCTRAEAVLYMWRLAGKPSAPASQFSDVERGTELASAIDWAVSKGITTGMTTTTFEPNTTCTRGQIVTFLWRAYA